MRSTVAMKAMMAITGLLLIAFLIAHMAGNLKLLLPDHGEEFNAYSHWLREFGYPALPHKSFLWAFRIVLLAAVVLHFVAAITLRRRAYRNTGSMGSRYARARRMEPSFAARTMLWGGIIIILFVIMHLLQFTAEVLRFGYWNVHSLPPFDRVVAGFSEWYVVLAYAIAMAAVCLHISHGFYSAFASLGGSVSKKVRRVLKTLSWIVAGVLFVGFMIAPVLILMGVIK